MKKYVMAALILITMVAWALLGDEPRWYWWLMGVAAGLSVATFVWRWPWRR